MHRTDDVSTCINIPGYRIKNLRYAKDVTKPGLQALIDELHSARSKYGLQMNVVKTKVMVHNIKKT